MIIGLKGAEKFIKIAWNVVNVDGEYPLGILLVAPPGVGKSYLLTSFKGENYIVLSDLSGHGLEKLLIELKDMQNGYIVLPDLIRAFTRHTTTALFSVLNMCLEEGITRIKRSDLSFHSEKPIRFGFIGAITPTELTKRQKEMLSVGLFSRLIKFSFTYTTEDKLRIIDYVSRNGMPKPEQKTPLEVYKPVPISIPENIVGFVKKIGLFLSDIKKDSVPFRSIKMIRRLLKGSAFTHRRKEVNIEDCILVYSLLPFITDVGTDLDYRLLLYIGRETILKKRKLSKKEIIESAKHYNQETIRNRLSYLEFKKFIYQDEDENYHLRFTKIGEEDGKDDKLRVSTEDKE